VSKSNFKVSEISNFQISGDGRTIVLHFRDGSEKISLEISTLNLEIAAQQIGSALTEAREISDIAQQNVIPFFRPTHARANLADGPAVAIEFRLDNGIEHRYGLAPNFADDLAQQILKAATASKKSKPTARH
jgi:hypothetical protein